MTISSQSFLVRRTCTRKSAKQVEQGSYPLDSYLNQDSYVLLGDPGSGKTEAFKREADELGGKYIKARDFATFDPDTKDLKKVLFIDAIDEMRADGKDGRTPLDQIRRHLDKIGCPRFRLSCREADWLGESDSLALTRVSPNDEVIVLHLDPLTESNVLEILNHKTSVNNPEGFIRKAQEHNLSGLLWNPQTLNLLVKAVGGNIWPDSRQEIFEMACRQLVIEQNIEHRQAICNNAPPPDMLLDAAGYLCAIHLLSGITGFSIDEETLDNQYYYWNQLTAHDLPLFETLKTSLFQHDGEGKRIPIHRSVAEFLGAHYLAKLVESKGLPFGRILALMTGGDGGVAPDLRGLTAWLSVHCHTGRPVIIERDPLGVVLYGDIGNFPVKDKKLVLTALKNEAERYPWFRSEDWSSSPFGMLGTVDMMEEFLTILSSSSREEADQALLDCVLDAIFHGEPMPGLAEALEAVARDSSYRPTIRGDAVRALLKVVPDVVSGTVSNVVSTKLLRLVKDIHDKRVEDRNDQMLGFLLRKLYPHLLSPFEILDYLHRPKDINNLGSYFCFWIYELPENTTSDGIPILLDQFVQRQIARRELLLEHQISRMLGRPLIRGLEIYGDSITNERLYDWLGIGLDKYKHSQLDEKYSRKIAQWFTTRSARYKAMIELGASKCASLEKVWYCMNRCMMRLHGATPPPDIGMWYLKKATSEKHNEIAEYYFTQAILLLKQQGGQQDLTLPALEFIESWIAAYLAFKPWLEPFISCPVGDWQQEQAIDDKERNIEKRKKKVEWVNHYRKHFSAIQDGTAFPQILFYLARAYNGLIYEASGETPRERLEDFLDNDRNLVEAAFSGFRRVLDRNDLPNINEIVSLELEGKSHYIREACLVGMNELYQCYPIRALQLDDAVLLRLLVFNLTYDVGKNKWVSALEQKRPDLAAEALQTYALPLLRAGRDHINGLYPLARNDTHSNIARIVLPPLLEGFPLRARKSQLGNALGPLLKAALIHLDKKLLAPIIMNKLKLSSMDAAQRVYWLTCGLVISSTTYTDKFLQHIGKNKVRQGYLASFLHGCWERGVTYSLSENILALIIELLAPDCQSEHPIGSFTVTQTMRTADMMRSFIYELGSNPSEISSRELERLIVSPKLTHWRHILLSALHTQRITRRKATFSHLSVKEVNFTLNNLQPSNAADLAALTLDHLSDIARKIHDGSTNDYKQYWSYDENNKKLHKPKPENDCRDALLSDLNERLNALNIDAEREGNYANDKRSDIKVSFGGANKFNIPIEIKRDCHTDLWKSIHQQLIPKYTRDPSSNGYGIYLVFWFGGTGMPPPDGKKVLSPKDLKKRLEEMLTSEEKNLIQICVINCALP